MRGMRSGRTVYPPGPMKKEEEKNRHIISRQGILTEKLDNSFPSFLEGHLKKEEYEELVSRFEAAYAVPMWPLGVVLVGVFLFCYSLSYDEIRFLYLALGLGIILACFVYFRMCTSKSDEKIRALCKETNKTLANKGITWEYTSQVCYNGMKHMIIHELIVALKDHSE